jgi:hypothetical protein
MTRRTWLPSLVVVAAGALAGCNQDPGADNGKGIDEPAPLPPSTASTPTYPPGPYALGQGATLADFKFQGFVDAQKQSATLEAIRFSDFYNPHGRDASYQPASPADDDRLYPTGSPYGAGTKKPRALFIDISAVWCGPCKEEAKSDLPGFYAKYKPCGGEFFFQLAEGAGLGSPVTQELLDAWTTVYKVSYPATFDPGHQLGELYASGFPTSAIVDTSTMQVVAFKTGLGDSSFWSLYESLLDPTCLAGK